MTLTRRDFLRAAAAAGGTFLISTRAGAATVERHSLLHPNDGRFAVWTDLHNHTLLSDGSGRADEAYTMLRERGLDAAALTDHATTQKQPGPAATPACPSTCGALTGLNEAGWQQLGELANAADDPGRFVAIRGFEWTTLALGHMNVWFSETWTDGLSMRGFGSARDAEYAAYAVQGETPLPAGDIARSLRSLLYAAPSPATIDGIYEWLASPANRPLLGGGDDAIAGFNHPNLYGNFADFRFDPRVVDRVVSLEMFSFGKRDYLFEGLSEGRSSPLVQCLDAGWRVGLLGVSDNHGSTFGNPAGRGGLWVSALTRDGIREALVARRFFAAAEPGIRVDATAAGARMGQTLPFRKGDLTVAVDVHVEGAAGRPLVVQVLTSGATVPMIVAAAATTAGASAPVRLTFNHDVTDGRWLVVRVCDPAQPANPNATGGYVEAGRAIAYASPFFLDPDAAA